MTILLLFVFSLDIFANKCDSYVVGSVWIHKGGAADEGISNYEGCRKGCFFNGSYSENGVRKCEKCSAITDPILCSDNGATCRWKQGSKKGKCISQSCPEIAKNQNAFSVNDPTSSVGRSRRYKECVEGTPKEQYFNNIYIQDYIANVNTQAGINTSLTYSRNLCDDRQPTTPGGTAPTQCRLLPATNKQRCEFNATQLWNNVANHRTPFEVCLNGPTGGGGEQQRYDNLTNKGDYKLLTGFKYPSEYCNHQVDVVVQQCTATYQTAINTCFTNNGLNSEAVERTHAGTKAVRKACHKIYHCMYSESNGRCSVWAIWAFVFFIVVMILVCVGVVIAVGALFPKIKGKIKDYAPL